MTDNSSSVKKPFFNCCAGGEEKKQAIVDLTEKKTFKYQSPPPSTLLYHASQPVFSVNRTSQAPKIRFTYLSPVEWNQTSGKHLQSRVKNI